MQISLQSQSWQRSLDSAKLLWACWKCGELGNIGKYMWVENIGKKLFVYWLELGKMLGEEANIHISNIPLIDLLIRPMHYSYVPGAETSKKKYLDPFSVFQFLMEPSYVFYKRGVTPNTVSQEKKALQVSFQIIIKHWRCHSTIVLLIHIMN